MKNKKLIIVLIMIISIVFSINFVYAENETSAGNNEGNTSQGENTGNNNTKQEDTKTEEPKANEQKTEGQKTEETKTTETPKEMPEKTSTTENKKSETNSNTKKTETTKTTTTQPATKSSNADLGNLGITPNDFSGFTASKTQYEVSVPNSVKLVEVYAKAKDSKATISGTGNVELKEGKNTEEVVVTAEDGTKKTYTIVITRLKEGEKLEKKGSSEKASLKNLSVSGFNLTPDFKEDVLEYTISFEGEQTSLDITAETNKSSDLVEIIGNENLADGENTITILVSNSKEDSTVIYEIKVNKNFEKAKKLQQEKEDAERWENIKKWGLRIFAFVAIFGLMFLIIIRHKKSQYDDYDEYEDKELPKSLRKSKKQENGKTSKKHKRNSGKHGK